MIRFISLAILFFLLIVQRADMAFGGFITHFDDVEIVTNVDPTLRLEQTAVLAGPYIWEVFGNESRFTIQDRTNPSIPLEISAGAPTTSFVIRESGNIGIGTFSPASKLHVAGGNLLLDNNQSIQLKDTNGTPRQVLKFGSGGGVVFTNNNNNNGGDMRFLTQGAGGESVRITSSGNVGIGTANPSAALDVIGSIEVNGVVVHASDKRFKKNIETIPDALDKVMKLRGIEFEWRIDEFRQMRFKEGAQMGLIGQEVESIIPEIVRTDPEGYKSVAYANVTALLIEAVKEQQKIIEEQKAELQEMKSRMAQFDSILQKLVAVAPTKEDVGGTVICSATSNAGIPALQLK